ncbi:hypothetical protein GCM10027262_57750 [Nocardia tengchongensis]
MQAIAGVQRQLQIATGWVGLVGHVWHRGSSAVPQHLENACGKFATWLRAAPSRTRRTAELNWIPETTHGRASFIVMELGSRAVGLLPT